MTFEELKEKREWQPILNCPGRFTLKNVSSKMTLVHLLGASATIEEFQVPLAKDKVLVVKLKQGGGVLSYLRKDGTYLHTLNTTEGLQRKLQQLGIIT